MKNYQDFISQLDHLETSSNVERKKYLQKIKIVRSLFFEGAKTNTEICEKFRISSPTSIRLLSQLIEDGLVKKEGQGKSVGGRKPDLYRLQEDSFYVLGIQLDRSKLRLAIYDNNNRTIIKEDDISFQLDHEASSVEELYKHGNRLIRNSKIDTQKLMGIGISMPGLVSAEEGKNFTYFISEEEPESLQEKLSKKFEKPVYILNDAKSACLAEFRFGLAKEKKNVLVISMDWGVGLGIIIDGKMHHGTSGFAGEFGHIPLLEDGLLCHCGKRGCLETEASGLALSRKVKEGLKAGESSILSKLSKKELEKIEPEKIIEAANKGDQFAINLLSEVGKNLGKGLAVLIQIFNPELIILEGKFTDAKQFITIPVQQSINTYCMAQLREKTQISLSNLGQDSVLLGAVAAVMENIFKDQIEIAKNTEKLVAS